MVDFYTGPTVGLTGCARSCSGRDEDLHEAENRSKLSASEDAYNVPETPTQGSPKNALITWPPTLSQEMVRHDSANWQMANRSNGSPFAVNWQPDNVIFRNGFMLLRLDDAGCPLSCDSKPYASGEYRTLAKTFGYGFYEARLKAGAGKGLVTSFFLYRGTHGERDHDEINFEVLGKDCQRVQTNYYVEGEGNHERMIDLGFNACDSFHNYGIEWSADSLTWHIDGRLVRQAKVDEKTNDRKLPYRPGQIMVNFWTGQGVDNWLGKFTYPGEALEALYDWIRYSALERSSGEESPAPLAQPAVGISDTPVSAVASPLWISKIQTSFFAFNGGHAARRGDKGIFVYVFDATNATNPGFGIKTGNRDLGGRNALRFELRGYFAPTGSPTRLLAQVYNETDEENAPSVVFDPVIINREWTELTVDLRDQIPKAQKILFQLATDKGSCNVEVRKMRFE